MRHRRKQIINTELVIDKSQLIDKKLIDKASLWILRIILKLEGHKELIDKDNYVSRENILAFLDGNKFLDEENTSGRKEVLEFFKQRLVKLERQKLFTSNKLLSKNIAQISSLMHLNKNEEKILEFFVLIKQYELLDDAVCLLGNELNTVQVKRALSVILNIRKKDIDKIFASNSKFSMSSLVTIDKSQTNSLSRKLDSISDVFLDNLLSLDEDISVMIKDSVRACSHSSLKIKDYKHLKSDIKILVPYLKYAIKTKQNGVNILLYGKPGTGKTELAKVLAKKLKTKLFEVSYIDENNEPIDGEARLKSYKSAQALLLNKKTIIMYDEAEDIFESSDGGFFSPPSRQKDKAWINRILETNIIPTIWITNNIESIDNALVRRFDMSIEVPIPKKSKREEIIRNYSNNLLDKKSIQLLAKNENIAPSLISTTAKVVSVTKSKNSSKSFTHLINNTLKAQGYEIVKTQKSNNSLTHLYNPSYVNTTTNLDELTQGIKKTKNARICLYGAAGTGKSAYAKYVAETLNKPLLLKKGSDLISMYVGGTEKNIANAFREAKEDGSVLVFDEVDSFLADRTQAKQSWEITQVNEMLVQMENFDGVFIATTNLMDNLDKASLRRFDLKLEFDYLKAEQAWKMFLSYCKDLKLTKPSLSLKKAIENLKYLTPGDFAAVVRQSKFKSIKNVQDFMQRLEDEMTVKHMSSENIMGFLAS